MYIIGICIYNICYYLFIIYNCTDESAFNALKSYHTHPIWNNKLYLVK